MKMKLKNLIIYILILVSITLTLPIPSYATTNEPNITAGAAILIDSSSGKILYSKNENDRMYPASTTKIMTAILTLENCNLDDIVTVPYEAIATIPSGYAVAPLQTGEQLTVKQLLQLMMVHSANDAANVLAYHISGSIENFATLMNNKVAELGLTNTHFVNPSGMHDDNHYTTAQDLAIIMQYCIKNPNFVSFAGLKSCTIPATNKYEERVFSNTNEMLLYDNREVSSNYYYKYITCGKTGYTSQAKNCLVTASNKDGLELISVVLSVGVYHNGLSGKFIETKELFEYGYNNFTIRKLREKDSIASSIELANATKETKNLDLLISDDITVLVKQEDYETEFTPEIEVNENLSAPIKKDQIIGKITYNIDGTTYSYDLKASHDVIKSDFFKLLIQITMIALILFCLYKLLSDSDRKMKKYRL